MSLSSGRDDKTAASAWEYVYLASLACLLLAALAGIVYAVTLIA